MYRIFFKHRSQPSRTYLSLVSHVRTGQRWPCRLAPVVVPDDKTEIAVAPCVAHGPPPRRGTRQLSRQWRNTRFHPQKTRRCRGGRRRASGDRGQVRVLHRRRPNHQVCLFLPPRTAPAEYNTRIALGYNRLATLPTAFALLSRLRYLNLKNNSFSVFPDVVSLTVSLLLSSPSRVAVDCNTFPRNPGHQQEQNQTPTSPASFTLKPSRACLALVVVPHSTLFPGFVPLTQQDHTPANVSGRFWLSRCVHSRP